MTKATGYRRLIMRRWRRLQYWLVSISRRLRRLRSLIWQPRVLQLLQSALPNSLTAFCHVQHRL